MHSVLRYGPRPMSSRVALLWALILALSCTSPAPPEGHCRYDSDCASGQVCTGTACRPQCHVDRDCTTGQTCVDSDRYGVRVCHTAVSQAQCYRTSDCPAGLYCLEGSCLAQCRADYDCRVINPFYSCAAGSCVLACATQTGDCDGVVRNGCETDLQRSATHCGTCGNACPAPANATATCGASGCGFACRAGFADCDGSAANGCEVELATDAAHCGACGTSCATPNGFAQCTAGACAVARCNAGFDDCDHVATNGCEARIDTAAHCGTCARTCSTGMLCASNACVPQCTAGRSLCGDACVDLTSSTSNCGACGHVCPVPTNGEATCSDGGCNTLCNAGWSTCSATGEACAVHVTVDTNNCGVCGRVCTAPANATPVCTAGACGYACNAGYVRGEVGCTPIPAPRAIAPSSLSTLNGSVDVTFEVAPRAFTDGAVIEICRDRACTRMVDRVTGTGTRITRPGALAAGTYFWRTYGRSGSGTGLVPSAAWEFVVPARPIPATASWGVTPDFNGDGRADLAVAEPNGNRIHVYFGLPTGFAATPSATLTVSTAAGDLGANLAAGDYNGDGFGDLVATSSFASQVYVFLGSAAGLAGTPTTLGHAPMITFGVSLASASDLNHDGYGDLAVGTQCLNGCSNTVEVFFGGAAGLGSTSTSLTPSSIFSDFGGTMAVVGRLDPSSPYESLVVLESFKGPPIARVYRGTATGIETTPSQNINFANYVGHVAAANDVNGDGIADVAFGPSSFSTGSAVDVYLGAAGGLGSTAAVSLTDDMTSGGPIVGLGDVNGDGFDDLLGTDGSTAARVYLGNAASTLVRGPLIAAPTPAAGGSYGSFGAGVAFTGDVDGDGLADAVIGAPDDGEVICAGSVFLFFGRPTLTAAPMPALRLTVPDAACHGRFGATVALLCAPRWSAFSS